MKPGAMLLFWLGVNPGSLVIASALWVSGGATVGKIDAIQPAALPGRTLPKLTPPKPGLELTDNPTAEKISGARVFEEPLLPVGGEPKPEENAALAAALVGYARRSGPDDFTSLAGFLETHPHSPWNAALLTELGLDYYNTAHYSQALAAWERAWALAKDASDTHGKVVGDRAAGELAYMYARLGRMAELEALLKSVEGRVFVGAATERIDGAREGLWNMKNRPEVSFRCGPLALQHIQLFLNPSEPAHREILDSASTTNGFSLPQVAELAKRIGLNYRMAFRPAAKAQSKKQKPEITTAGGFIVPSVVHWKVGHYAALVRQEGDRYLLEDPTFGNTVWATRQAIESETSGYFLIPPGTLPDGWRTVDGKEGAAIWGKGQTSGNDPGPHGPSDPKTGGAPCKGMAVASVHLMLVNLNLNDEPLGYLPPVGPPVRLMVRYNHRDAFQPATFTYANFGPKWTCDWISYITDNPQSPAADVRYYIMGGGTRTFSGFNTNTQTYAYQQFDHTRLTRTSATSYEMLWADSSRLVFSQPDGSIGTSRKIFLSQIIDPSGNAVTLSYDANLRLTAITDAIGQVTTLTYGNTNDIYKITKVTDPFGRLATFDYDGTRRLSKITDVIGLTSEFSYEGNGDFINALVTTYGTTAFTRNGPSTNTTRWLETLHPDGSRERVEYNQTVPIPASDPAATVPTGGVFMNTFLAYRNTYYWSRTAGATAYGDYTKARVYHWLHTANIVSTAGILESTKEPLENRVWYNYAGQSSPTVAGTKNLPNQVARVLDDGTTQLYNYSYNGFGRMTQAPDPVGRRFTYVYDTNGIDLLEVRQTRGTNNQLIFQATYNAQHLPLTTVDAAGQISTFTYNSRGQLLTETNPKNETVSYTYDPNGYLVAVDGPLPGTNDLVSATYDAFGRVRTKTDVSGYTLTLDYDDLDRITRITYPDATFDQVTYHRLQPALLRDRAGRETLLEYDALGQMTRRIDALGRSTQFQWCTCGDMRSFTDPMGRTTTWHKDVQGRVTAKQYGDGSTVHYVYENTTSRLRQVIDEKKQISQFAYNRDNTLKSIAYANATVPTPGVTYTYDPDYERVTSMTDGIGKTVYEYVPITPTSTPGAGQLASIDGPLPHDTIAYGYDELGRRTTTTINAVAATIMYDAAGRVVGETNALGLFTRMYEGSSGRVALETFPNGLGAERVYSDVLQDKLLQRLTHRVGSTPISEFIYGHNHAAGRIETWSQQAETKSPIVKSFGYDAANQLLSATVTNAGVLVDSFAYTYDPLGNRLSEQKGVSIYTATYNALNQINTSTAPGASRTNEWDAKNRLVAVNSPGARTEFTYDGMSRLHSIRHLTNGVEASLRRFLWCDNDICEERDASGAVTTKRFFPQGVKIETGLNAGSYFYTRDHLGSVRELTDSSGQVRARYSYEPFGRRTRVSGDIDADFGFTGLFFADEAGLALARYRVYDATLGRWLSRDPLGDAEEKEGPNLYAYVGNDPINNADPLGLQKQHCCQEETKRIQDMTDLLEEFCDQKRTEAERTCAIMESAPELPFTYGCADARNAAEEACGKTRQKYGGTLASLGSDLTRCSATCGSTRCPAGGGTDWAKRCSGAGRFHQVFGLRFAVFPCEDGDPKLVPWR